MSVRKTSHRRSLTIVCIAATAVAFLGSKTSGGLLGKLMVQTRLPGILGNAELRMQNMVSFAGRMAKENPNLVFLAIDAESQSLDNVEPEELAASPALQIMKQGFPFSRDIYPLILDRLFGAGARAVILDMRVPTPRDGDEAFRAALDRYRDRVVVGYNLPEREEGAADQASVEWPSTTLIPKPGPDDPRLGFVTLWTDLDEVVRHVWFRRTLMEVRNLPPLSGEVEPVFESLAARGVRQAGFGSCIPQDTKPRRLHFADWGSQVGSAYQPHSLYEIFTPDFWQHNYGNGEFFRNKIVLLGPWGNWSKDYVQTPYGQVAGPLFHLNAMNGLLSGDFLVESPWWVNLLLIALAGGISWALGFCVRQPKPRVVLLVAGCLGWFAAAVLCFDLRIVIPVFAPMLALFSSGSGFLYLEYLLEQHERQRIRRTLEGYVSRDVVKEVLDNPESYLHTVGGARRKISVLFSDIRGFTAITEVADAARLVQQLNEYFTEMVRIVFEHVGTMDKFIGDAVMAHWGGIVSHGDQQDACHAVSTALQMLRELERLNADWKQRGMLELHIGVGINHGDAICGHLGSHEKHDFSVIGDPVNLASRLESATKQFHVDLLLGGTLAPLVGHRFQLRTVDLIQAAGKSEPVEIFTALGEKDEMPMLEWLVHYEEGIRHYRERAFQEAIRCFETAGREMPGDWLIGEYLRRCQDYAENPPGPEWNGIFVMHKK